MWNFFLLSVLLVASSCTKEKQAGGGSLAAKLSAKSSAIKEDHCNHIGGSWDESKGCDIEAVRTSCVGDGSTGGTWNDTLHQCDCSADEGFFFLEYFKTKDGAEKQYQCVNVSEVSQCQKDDGTPLMAELCRTKVLLKCIGQKEL